MAHHKSALKRIRQTAKRNERNRALRSQMRTVIKNFRDLLEADTAKAKEAYPTVQKALDKAVTKGILHSATAARYKSRLNQALNKQLQPAQASA